MNGKCYFSVDGCDGDSDPQGRRRLKGSALCFQCPDDEDGDWVRLGTGTG